MPCYRKGEGTGLRFTVRISRRAKLTVSIDAATLEPVTDGSLVGSLLTVGGTIDLTAGSPADWAHWGSGSRDSFDHKGGVAQQISDLTSIGAGDPVRFTNNPTQITWSGGVPRATSSGAETTGVYKTALGSGFERATAADRRSTRRSAIPPGTPTAST